MAIGKLEKEWTEHPILHLDLNIARYASTSDLEDILNRNLVAWEKLYGADPAERSLPLRFAGIIDRAYHKTGQRAVILIDEYDKPLLQALHDEETQNQLRNMLKPFYGVLKTMDRAIRFALLTGVTKFGKVSVFSDLNNLMDISMDNRYVKICGITGEEILIYLRDELQTLADIQGMSNEETLKKLKEWYDGYHFTAKSEGIYNPFSLLKPSLRWNSETTGSRPGHPPTSWSCSSTPITTSTRWPTRRLTPMCSTASTPPRTIPYPSSTKVDILRSRIMPPVSASINKVSRT